MTPRTNPGQCVKLRTALESDRPALLRSAAVEESWRGAEHYFPRFGFSCVSRDSVTPEVKSSVEFQEACPASATVMRKSLR